MAWYNTVINSVKSFFGFAPADIGSSLNLTTKERLTSDKAALENKRAVLQTKAGADAFIVAEVGKIDAVLPTLKEPKLKKGQVSMKTFLTTVKAMMAKAPNKVVEAEIARTEKRIVEIDTEVKAIDDKGTDLSGGKS